MANSLKISERELRHELEKVKKSESLYRLLAENTSDLIRYQLPSGEFNYVSPNIFDITGYTAEEYYEFEPLENVVPEDHDMLLEAVEEFKNGADTQYLEYRINHKSGKIIWLESRMRAIRDDSSALVALVSSSNDITEKKETNQKLNESVTRYRQLVELAVDAIYLLNGKGIVVDTNQQATIMLEKSKEEIIGKTVEVIDPNFPAEDFIKYWDVIPFDEQRTFKTTHIDKSGKIIPIEICGKKFKLDGETFYYGIARDISDRKISEEKLKLKQYHLEKAQLLGKIGSWDLDIVKDTLLWTDESYKIFGIPVGTPMNYNLFLSKVHPDDREYVDRKWSAAMQGEDYDINHRILMDDGKVKWVREKADLVFDDKKNCIRGIGFTQDITSRIKSEKLIQEKVKEYQTLNEEYQSLNEEFKTANQELKEAFFQIEASEKKFKSYMDSAPDGIFIVDENGNYLEVNAAACRISGYTNEELLKRSIPDILQKGEVEKGISHFNQVKKEGYAEGELGYITKSGENRFWQVSAIKLSDNRFLGFVKDITKQKAYQIRLETSEKRFRELVDTINSGVAIYSVINNGKSGSDYIIRDFNQFALNHENMIKEEVIGKSLKDIRPNIDDYGLIDVFREVWQTGESKFFPATVYVDENYSNYYENRVFRIPSGEIVAIYDDVTKRETAIVKLAENESKLKNIIENSTNLFFSHSADHKITFISPQIKEYLGFEPDEVLTDWTKFITDNPINEKALEYTKKAIETGERQPTYELEMLRKDGKKLIVEVREAPVIENGKVVSIVGSLADITDRKKAERKILNQNEEYEALNDKLHQTNAQLSATIAREEEINDRYNKAMKASSDGIFDWNLTTNEIYYSPRWKSLLGYSDDELPNDFSVWETLTDPEDVKRSWNTLNALIDGKIDKFDIEFKMKHKDGHWVDIHSRADVFRDKKGQAIRVVGTHTDISERKEADALLRKSEQNLKLSHSRYQKAEEIGKVGNWEYNVVTDMFWASDESKRIYGFDIDTESFSTEKVENCIPERERVHQALIDLIEKDEPYDLEFEIITSDKGVRKTITSVAESIKDNWGNPLKVIGVIQDVTERVQFENKLKNAKEKAEESDRLKSAFLANMSHEIRTPMNGILGFADLLKQPDLNTESHQKYIRIIEESGTRMLSVINDIIDISKIEAGLMELNLNETNVNEQIEYIYTFFKPELDKKGLDFSYTNSLPAKEATIITDSEKLYAVFTNLIKNAIKYTEKGSIELGFELKGSNDQNCDKPGEDPYVLQFYVKDTGIGIPKERQNAIFERFIQADIEDKMAHQGAGLGLAITKNYVEKLGGKIWVESEVNKGSIFYFTLPYNIKSAEGSSGILTDSTDNHKAIRSLKILIAEDDEVSEMLMNETVALFSKEILKAKTGVEAVDICRQNPDLDLVLMDIRMPVMGGYEAIKLIREFNKKVIIIAQTAYGLSGDREKTIEAGCNDYISKPIKKSQLLEMINRYFGE